MATDHQLDMMLRARVTIAQKQQLEAIALENQISVSDVVREALRKFLADSHHSKQPEMAG